MATVKCALGKRGRPSHEWNDGEKDRIYCLGWVDPIQMTRYLNAWLAPILLTRRRMTWRHFTGGLTMEIYVMVFNALKKAEEQGKREQHK